VITASDRADWEAWLAAHHDTEQEVWLVYFKKATGKPTIAYADAVEVAVRYGWIDGLVRRIDEERYMQRWTPRRPRSKWSKTNRAIAERLIESGEMSPRGLAAVEAAKQNGEWEKASA
jgi:uncharacterized protein YdeI (YjbR/CyaY-like superfamily)